jgi:hypothetical protein
MAGGATIVLLVVLQESRMTVSAIVPATAHNNLSRLPWIHRISFEFHTNREYAQKPRKITKLFFGVSYMPV